MNFFRNLLHRKAAQIERQADPLPVRETYAPPAPPAEDGMYWYQIPSGEWVPVQIMGQRMTRLVPVLGGQAGVLMAECPGAIHGPLVQPGTGRR